MSKSTGTIVGGSGLNFLGALHTAIDAHAAWEHVETITNTPATGDDLRIYKCLGTVNSYGTDYYVALLYDASSPNGVYVALSESYNAATNEFSNYAPLNNVSPNVAADGSIGTANTDPLAFTNAASQTALFSTSIVVTTNTTTFDYYISITNDRLVFSTSIIGGNFGVYVGLYENFVQIANNFPIVVMLLGSNSNSGSNATDKMSQGATTRHPGRESQAASTYHFTVSGGAASSAIWVNSNLTTVAIADTGKDRFTNGGLASRIAVVGGGITTTALSLSHGLLRGMLKDTLIINAENTVVFGDTFTFGTVYDVIGRRSSTSGDSAFMIPQGV